MTSPLPKPRPGYPPVPPSPGYLAQPFPSQPPQPQPYQPRQSTGLPGRAQTRQFAFDGGAGTYLGTALLGFLITVLTLGLLYPFSVVLRERWRAKHSYIEGRQLMFNGSAWGLFGLWWKWFLLIIISLGVYSFWVGPRIYRWKWEHTSWALQAPGYFAPATRG